MSPVLTGRRQIADGLIEGGIFTQFLLIPEWDR
jgi:hypothetical protein